MRVAEFAVLVFSVVTLGCSAGPAAQASGITTSLIPPQGPRALIGTWRLVEFWDRDSIGAPKRYPYCQQPTGYFVYDPSGHVSIQIQTGPTPPIIQAQRGEDWFRQASAEELRTSMDAFRAYFGTYVVDFPGGHVIHQVEGDSRSLYTGTAQRRRFRLVRDSLIIGDDTTARRVLLRLR